MKIIGTYWRGFAATPNAPAGYLGAAGESILGASTDATHLQIQIVSFALGAPAGHVSVLCGTETVFDADLDTNPGQPYTIDVRGKASALTVWAPDGCSVLFTWTQVA